MRGSAVARVIALALALVPALLATPARGEEELSDAVRRCEELLPALREGGGAITRAVAGGGVVEETFVRLSWTEGAALGRPRAAFLVCAFYPRATTHGAWQFVRVLSSRYGVLSRYDVQQLYKFLRVGEAIGPARPPAPAGGHAALYVAQQAINALSLGCVYALVAVAFSLVYGITGVINLALGELAMIGAWVTFLGSLVIAPLAMPFVPAGAALLLPVAAIVVAGYGLALNAAVFRPLAKAAPTVPLIAMIGVAIALEEAVRLLQGPRTQWLPFNPDAIVLVGDPAFSVVASRGHVLVGLAALAITLGLWWLARTGIGRQARAVAEDGGTAALLGIDVGRVTALVVGLGALLAGAAGSFAASQYGAIDAAMGGALGFKALAAAIVGGFGSAPGAALGGLLIASAETATAATLGSAWKDVAAFAALVLVLVFRPQGLLGRAKVERV